MTEKEREEQKFRNSTDPAYFEEFLKLADAPNREAMLTLRDYGFKFGTHYGYGNAADFLRDFRLFESVGHLEAFFRNRGITDPPKRWRRKVARRNEARRKTERRTEEQEGPERVFR